MSAPPPIQIKPARSSSDLCTMHCLFRAYANSLKIDLAYQGFAAELATLPGAYAPPRGELLLAISPSAGDQALGCVCLRPILPDGCCEMKRLYVSPEGRGRGLGRALVEAVVGVARRMGYRFMRLDTLPTMVEATALYRSIGFRPVEPYYDTPVEGTVFLERELGLKTEWGEVEAVERTDAVASDRKRVREEDT